MVVRPIWLCTCFSKDQAPLVDDLLLALPSDSMKRMVFKLVLQKSNVTFFGQSSSIEPCSLVSLEYFWVRNLSLLVLTLVGTHRIMDTFAAVSRILLNSSSTSSLLWGRFRIIYGYFWCSFANFLKVDINTFSKYISINVTDFLQSTCVDHLQIVIILNMYCNFPFFQMYLKQVKLRFSKCLPHQCKPK